MHGRFQGVWNTCLTSWWQSIWDGENRLVSVESRSDAPAGSKRRLTFQYDPQGRRILKAVQTWTNSAWSIVLSNVFVYDGWNLVAELNATNKAVIRSYVWGLDLSGTQQGAGAVGAMLALNDPASGTHLVAYDGNGNVSALLNATNGTISAQYEYGPFAEVLRATGPMAKTNPHRFSTKYQDDETDLVYYGYRYYNGSTGRWNNRDPLEEAGGCNLHGMARNNAVNRIDRLGLDDGDSFFMMFIEFVTHTGDSAFCGYSDSIWNSILEHEEVIDLYFLVLQQAAQMRTCCKKSYKTFPARTLIFRQSFFRWDSWGGVNAGFAIGTATLDVGTSLLEVKCDDKQCTWRADFMFTLKDKYSFRSIDDFGVEHPWYTLDNNLILRPLELIGKDFDIADRRFVTKTGTFPCHRD